MHVVNDFRGVLQMTLNVLNRKAEAEPTIGDIAYELKRSGGYMVDLVTELEKENEAHVKEREHLYTHMEVAEWLAEYHGKYRELTLTDWVARKRAEKKG
jgi:hypothetical protein